MNLTKLIRQFFAEREKAAFTSDQVRRLLHTARLVDAEPPLADVFKAVKKLVALGHLSSRVDPDTEGTVYQVTAAGIAAHEAS